MKTLKEINPKVLLQRWFFFILFVSVPVISIAQEETQKDKFQSDFESFKLSVQKDFETFKSSNDSAFAKFLEETWTEFELFIDKKQGKPKPEIQPKIDTSDLLTIRKLPIIIKPIDIEKEIEEYKPQIKPPIIREITNIQQISSSKQIFFYGTKLDFPLIQSSLPQLKANSNSGIASFFHQAADSEEISLYVHDIYDKSNKLKLNGWGTLKLIQTIADELYSDVKDQIVFTWFLLIKTGYKAKVAYVDNEIFLLCNFDVPLYNNKYCEIKSEKFYIVLFGSQKEPNKQFYTYKGKHASQVNKLSLKLNELPLLKTNIISKTIKYKKEEIKIQTNKNLIDFYNTYPNCDLSIYITAPLSAIAINTLNEFFKPKLEGQSDFQKVIILLNFVQNGIKYQIDQEQFGKENYLFAEETLYYPFADCEDRVALLSQLIKHYTGLEYIGLDYPNHLSMAVNIPDAFIGASLKYNNKIYHFCDPTYIGAGIGMVMPELRDVKPVIIDIY